jgi:hypothetical protein
MGALLPDKLIPLASIPLWLLPAWISDCGVTGPLEDYPDGLFAIYARHEGELLHCTCARRQKWREVLPGMINNLGGMIFEREFPGQTIESFMWEARRNGRGGAPLTAEQEQIIARRKELTWRRT